MSGELLDWALRYAARGFRVFPLHGIVDGKCSCGKTCGSPGKHPRIRKGFRNATTDADQIRRWWGRWTNANIGIATGSGIAVIDIDGREGFEEFRALIAANRPIPETLVAQTGNGLHLVFATRDGGPEVRNSARGNVHVRGEGGYIVAAPSLHYSGRKYQWIKQATIATLPEWLRQWSQGYEISGQTSSRGQLLAGGGDRNANLPGYLGRYSSRNVSTILDNSLNYIEYSPSEVERLRSALKSIPADRYELWFQVGMALHSLGWTTNEGDVGFELFDQWSATCPEKYSAAATEAKWNSFGRSGRSGITVASIYHLAKQHGWNPAVMPQSLGAAAVEGGPAGQKPPSGSLNGTNGHSYALPPGLAVRPILWPDTTEEGKPRITLRNAMAAIGHAGIQCRYDQFHNRELVNGALLQSYGLEKLVDDTVVLVRDHIREAYGVDFKKENTFDALETLCKKTQFDPVLDYLAGLQWDGVPRLSNWLTTYMAADIDEFTSTVGRLTLIAAVRRARHPGERFDQMLVLEGSEGSGKSTAIQILAGLENFSDQRILDQDEKTQQEMLQGVWLYEISELGGMRRAEVEHVKSFLSRHEDRARPAYARKPEQKKRRCVFIGTTNRDDDYLISETGNRRFWGVKVGRVDLKALQRDRDQLWAEAAAEEARGVSIALPERLWSRARENQESRKQLDIWLEPIHNYIELKGLTQFKLTDLMTSALQLSMPQIGYREQQRAVAVLRQLGFRKTMRRVEGKPINVYVKSEVA